ncbi:peptidyl-dipeptidase [Sesbania bispinosa]|nr:peptidyl-dipeptidase [Sesbania bispinosa]
MAICAQHLLHRCGSLYSFGGACGYDDLPKASYGMVTTISFSPSYMQISFSPQWSAQQRGDASDGLLLEEELPGLVAVVVVEMMVSRWWPQQ